MHKADHSLNRDSTRQATPKSAAHQRCAIFLKSSHDNAIDAAEAAIDAGDVILSRRLYTLSQSIAAELEAVRLAGGNHD
jgi:hypothetical protein